ncbi:MAG: hypothetical protein ACTSQY_00755 [Candidatus Odinarchaeia archaeon]
MEKMENKKNIEKIESEIEDNLRKNEYTVKKIDVLCKYDFYGDLTKTETKEVTFWGKDFDGNFLGYFESWSGSNWTITKVILDTSKTNVCKVVTDENTNKGKIESENVDFSSVVMRNTKEELDAILEELADHVFCGCFRFGYNIEFFYDPEDGKIKSGIWMGNKGYSMRGNITITLKTMTQNYESYIIDFNNTLQYIDLSLFDDEEKTDFFKQLREYNKELTDKFIKEEYNDIDLSEIDNRLVYDNNAQELYICTNEIVINSFIECFSDLDEVIYAIETFKNRLAI